MREPRVFEDVRYLVADEHVEELRRDAAARRQLAAARRAAERNHRAEHAVAGARVLPRPAASRGSLASCPDESDRKVGAPA